MTKWIVIVVVVGLVLFAALRGCGDGSVPIPDPITTDTLDMSRVDTLVVHDSIHVSRVDTLFVITDGGEPQEIRCPQFSINRASYTCR